MKTRSLKLFADYFQFHLMDAKAELRIDEDLWTPEAVARLLTTSPGVVLVGTVRNVEVPVEIRVQAAEPDARLDGWDHVVHCSLEVPSGQIVVAGSSDYGSDGERIQVDPGTYRVQVCYGSLDSLSEDGLKGEDHYRVTLWPGTETRTRVLKQRRST